MKYGLNARELTTIRESIEKYPNMSIFILMKKLKCTADKAIYIQEYIIPELKGEMHDNLQNYGT